MSLLSTTAACGLTPGRTSKTVASFASFPGSRVSLASVPRRDGMAPRQFVVIAAAMAMHFKAAIAAISMARIEWVDIFGRSPGRHGFSVWRCEHILVCLCRGVDLC